MHQVDYPQRIYRLLGKAKIICWLIILVYQVEYQNITTQAFEVNYKSESPSLKDSYSHHGQFNRSLLQAKKSRVLQNYKRVFMRKARLTQLRSHLLHQIFIDALPLKIPPMRLPMLC